ncbi:MAG TPA: hypothetical protein VIP55_02045 [Agromyces sp.]|jgi:hypothetical protein|uniref:Uncharacterized protein n=2 Tax=Agromyces TaxID=33877 RepID=A0A852WNB9_9MICO|nr:MULTISPECIES: hypothetical protein [Agromyces]KQZ07464.1 hypothetical protein ASD23_16535 [Agromyces sp. Root1464]NYG19419.1 hypothetical protein [Agromyces hippuratus]RXZ46477.1 hypothetical protein ESP57_16390 [Agromyces fucosus]
MTINSRHLENAANARDDAYHLIEEFEDGDVHPRVLEVLESLDTALFDLINWADQVTRHLAESGVEVVDVDLT